MAAFLLSKPCSPRFPSLSSGKTPNPSLSSSRTRNPSLSSSRTPNSVHLCLSSKPYSTCFPSFSSVSSKTLKTSAPKSLASPSASYEPQKGAELLLESLELMGIDTVFAVPGCSSMEILQLLTRSDTVHKVLLRHEQGPIVAAVGYAGASGRPGVCIASSGSGATNLVTGLAAAHRDGVPVVAITCQVPLGMMGTDAFQETPIIEVTKSITKHNYRVQVAENIPSIFNEAFFLATTGRPGPVLIDIPKDLLQKKVIADWRRRTKLHGYLSTLPKTPESHELEQILSLLGESKKPILLVGGGCLNSSSELRLFAKLTGIPVTSTMKGIGVHPSSHELSMGMVGMHGSVNANYAVDRADLLLAFGVRFNNQVTGSKVKAFAHKAKIVHIDIDGTEIGKKKQPHFSICGDVNAVLEGLISLLKEKDLTLDFSAWGKELKEQKMMYPLSFNSFGDAIHPLYAIQVLGKLTNSDAIITTGVGQHQIWAVKGYNFKRPRQLLTSGGLGATGFGLPAAIGAAKARPGSIVVDIEGDGSFNMNIQELATVYVENLPVKIMILNNQHLGLVAQNWLWENQLYKEEANTPTNLGRPGEIFPDFLKFAEGCNIPADRVTKKSGLMGAIKKMLETPGPYLLDVIVPHEALVLPVLPSGGAFGDMSIMG